MTATPPPPPYPSPRPAPPRADARHPARPPVGPVGAVGATAADRPVTLPTGRLLGASIVPPAVVATAWLGLAAALGWDGPRSLSGVLGAGWVAVVGGGLILALTPWKPRKLAIWPMVWTAAGFVRLIAALGGGLLLYSRPEIGGAAVFAPVTAAYLAVMAFETREYARAMGRLQPTDVGPEPTDDPTSTHSSE